MTSLLAILMMVFLVVPSATAGDRDDLKRKQKAVQGQISKATKELHQSSTKVNRLTAKLTKARLDLQTARRTVTRVSGQLETARTKSKLAKKELQTAQTKLNLAAAALRKAQLEVEVQRRELRGSVVQTATEGDNRIKTVSALINARTLEDVMIERTLTNVVVSGQQRSLTGLEEAEAAMEREKKKVEKARDMVAKKKRAAEKQLQLTRTLYTKAALSKKRVKSLVTTTAAARRAADRARAVDEAALRRLRAREAAIKNKILAAGGGANYTGDTGGLLRMPVDPGYVTDSFGWRTHPIHGYRSFHNGTDFGSPNKCGAALIASRSGKVVNAYYDEVYGHRLYINVGRVNGALLTLVYNHASDYRVSVGSFVNRGSVVGTMGTTGWSTGCHLHFTVLRNGEPVDPAGYL